MPKSEESGKLARLHPAFTYCAGKLDEALHLHSQHPTEENLLRVADLGRFAWNVGASLASDAGMERGPWAELMERSRTYCASRGKVAPMVSDHKTIGLLLDVVYELQRDVRQLRDALSEKIKLAEAV